MSVIRLVFEIVILSCYGVYSYPDLPPNLTYFKRSHCDIKCNGEEHTLCKFEGRSSSCHKYSVSYNTFHGEMMLNEHNAFRNDLANRSVFPASLPTASNLRLMKWDKELATIAHRWLAQCIMGHDACRDTKNDKVGQNVGFLVGEELSNMVHKDVKAIFDKWCEEINFATNASIASFTNDSLNRIPNFGQIIWHSTYRIGCSDVIYFKRNNNPGGEHSRTLRNRKNKVLAVACNYAPKGNIVGEPMYGIGDPAKGCPQGTKPDVNFEFLCGKGGDLNRPGDFELINPGTSYAQTVRNFQLTTIFAGFFHRVQIK